MPLLAELGFGVVGGYKYFAPLERSTHDYCWFRFFFYPRLFSDQVIAYSDALRSITAKIAAQL
jgi:hypothetical protein